MVLCCQHDAYAQDVRTYIHPNAVVLVPIYKSELKANFPSIPQPWYVLGLTEHESCQTLRSKRCFSSTSTFETKWDDHIPREFGAGLGMITKAWDKLGKPRMDTLASLKKAYPYQLKDLTWDNIKQRPDLQIRAMVLLIENNYRALSIIKDPIERLKFADSAYNGGLRDTLSARRICGITRGCDPNIWFGHVEKHCVKSKSILYGSRSACDINTHHVFDVFKTRMPKYQAILPEL